MSIVSKHYEAGIFANFDNTQLLENSLEKGFFKTHFVMKHYFKLTTLLWTTLALALHTHLTPFVLLYILNQRSYSCCLKVPKFFDINPLLARYSYAIFMGSVSIMQSMKAQFSLISSLVTISPRPLSRS